MATKDTAMSTGNTTWNVNTATQSAPGGAVYGLGFIGALVFYFQQADTFWLFVLGFLKAIVWPAMLVYKLLA